MRLKSLFALAELVVGNQTKSNDRLKIDREESFQRIKITEFER